MEMKLRHCKSNTLCEMLLQTMLLISDKFNRGSINNIGSGAIVHFGQHFLLKGQEKGVIVILLLDCL